MYLLNSMAAQHGVTPDASPWNYAHEDQYGTQEQLFTWLVVTPKIMFSRLGRWSSRPNWSFHVSFEARQLWRFVNVCHVSLSFTTCCALLRWLFSRARVCSKQSPSKIRKQSKACDPLVMKDGHEKCPMHFSFHDLYRFLLKAPWRFL